MGNFEAVSSNDVDVILKYQETVDGNILFTNDSKVKTKFYLYEVVVRDKERHKLSDTYILHLKNQYETIIACKHHNLKDVQYIAFDTPIEDIKATDYTFYIVRAIIDENSTLSEAVENNMLNFYSADTIYYILHNGKIYLIETR